MNWGLGQREPEFEPAYHLYTLYEEMQERLFASNSESAQACLEAGGIF